MTMRKLTWTRWTSLRHSIKCAWRFVDETFPVHVPSRSRIADVMFFFNKRTTSVRIVEALSQLFSVSQGFILASTLFLLLKNDLFTSNCNPPHCFANNVVFLLYHVASHGQHRPRSYCWLCIAFLRPFKTFPFPITLRHFLHFPQLDFHFSESF